MSTLEVIPKNEKASEQPRDLPTMYFFKNATGTLHAVGLQQVSLEMLTWANQLIATELYRRSLS